MKSVQQTDTPVPARDAEDGHRLTPRSVRKSRWSRYRLPAISTVSVIITIAVWEIIGRHLSRILFAPPSEVVSAGVRIVQTSQFWDDTRVTLQSLVIGFAISASSAIVLGVLAGRYQVVNAVIRIQIVALYVVPEVALIPLFIVWFGLETTVQVAIVIFSSIFAVYMATSDGVRAGSEDLLDVARVEGSSDWQLLRKVVLPATLPYIITGVRIGLGRAVVGVIVAEMFTSISGLGGEIIVYGNAFETDKLLFVVFVISMIGLALTKAVGLFERRFAAWKSDAK